MNPRSIILIILAVMFAGGTVYVANSWLNAQRAAFARKEKPKEAPKLTEVLVAKANLPTGTLIKPEHLRWQAWPETSMPKNYVRKVSKEGGKQLREAFVGAVLRRGITIGEPVTDDRVVKPGERGFLAAVLHPDMRAISVSVNATTSAAGFIFPGDRVDLLLTHKIKRKQRVSETFLTNIRVIAVDQRTDDQNSKAKVAKTVTFEVTPKQVEMINVARNLGRLSLSLRALPRDAGKVALPAEVEQQTTTIVANNAPEPAAELGTHLAFDTGPVDACGMPLPEPQEMVSTEDGEAGPRPLIPAGALDCHIATMNERTEPATQPSEQVAVKTGMKMIEPEVQEEDYVPGRGRSHTVDSEVSRMLGWQGPQVTVLRGRNSVTSSVKVTKDGSLKIEQPGGSAQDDNNAGSEGNEDGGEDGE